MQQIPHPSQQPVLRPIRKHQLRTYDTHRAPDATKAYQLQSATQSYYQYPQSNYTSPASAQQPTSAGSYYPTQGQQGYAGSQSHYGQYGHTQYGFNHTSFGPNNSQSNGQYMHTSQSLPPSHPAYLVSVFYSFKEPQYILTNDSSSLINSRHWLHLISLLACLHAISLEH
jgi:hypothetical protein